MAVYEGKHGHNVTRDGIPLDMAPSLKVWNHSPTGFSWGYGGSGPAQLALALLLDVTGDAELSARLNQTFKWAFVAGWPTGWRITSERIRDWVDERRPADEEAD